MTTLMIEVENLRKSFDKQVVLNHLTFNVASGEVYSLLGMNGSGKTTIIKILTTLSHKDSGIVLLGGFDVEKKPRKVAELLSLTGQFTAVDEQFTAQENLELIGRLRHIEEPKKVALALLKQFDLLDVKNKLVVTFSGGMKRRLDIAMSLIGNPTIIFLDEPTTGLDPKSRLEVWQMIHQLKQDGVTVFLTTQYIEEAEKLADRVGILKDGKIVAEGTPKELKSTVEENGIDVSFYSINDFDKAATLFSAYEQRPYSEEYRLQILTDGSAKAFADVVMQLEQNEIELRLFSKIETRLEDIFLKIVAKEVA